MITGAPPTSAFGAAVNVSMAHPVPEFTGLPLKVASTPDGSPAALSVTAPENDPPVLALRLIVVDPRWYTAAELDSTARLSVGTGATAAPHSFTSNAPSTDPNPVARL